MTIFVQNAKDKEEEEEKVKTILPQAVFTVAKGQAFAYQIWTVKKVIEDDDDSLTKSPIILKFNSRRNMHVKIPNSQAYIPPVDNVSKSIAGVF